MKLIAHRGWSAGGDENTLAAFARAACGDRISGVEFDLAVYRTVDWMLAASGCPCPRWRTCPGGLVEIGSPSSRAEKRGCLCIALGSPLARLYRAARGCSGDDQ